MVKIVIGNIYSKIVGVLPDPVQKELDRTLSYSLPDARFIPKVKEGKWDGVIRLYYRDRGQAFYTGLLSLVRDILNKYKEPFELLDRRVRPAVNMPELVFNPPSFYEERDYQAFTIDRSLKFTRGVLGVATGGGKTMIVTKLIGRLKTYPFMFYVLTKDLMEQAHDVLSTCLNQPIGMIGDGKCDIKKISVCTIQTATLALHKNDSKFKISDYAYDDEDSWDEKGIENAEKAEKIKKLIELTNGIYMDECVSGDTKIITEKGEVFISDVIDKKCRFVQTYDGNNIVFKPILNWWKKGIKETIKIKTTDGRTLICTKDHLIYTERGWIKAGNLLTMDKLFFANADAERRFSTTINTDQEDMFLAIKSARELGKSGEKYIVNTLRNCLIALAAVAKRFPLDIKRWTNLLMPRAAQLACQDISAVMINSQYGKNIILNPQRKNDRLFWEPRLGIQAYYFPTSVLKIIDWQPTMGFVSPNGLNSRRLFYLDMGLKLSTRIIPDMVKNGLECILFAFRLLRKSLAYCMSVIIRKLRPMFLINWATSESHGGSAMTEVGLENIYLYTPRVGLKEKMISLKNGFAKKVIPARFCFIEKGLRNIGMYFFQKIHLLNYLRGSSCLSRPVCDTNWCRVKEIIGDLEQNVYDIEVEDTHCFFANDILVHNCHHTSAKTVKDVLLASPNAYWRFGGSATPYRDTGDEIMIQAVFGGKIVDISASYLIKKNHLVRPYIFFEPIDSNVNLHSYAKIYEACIAKNNSFNTHVAATANHLVSRGLSTLILVKQYSQGDFLKTLIPDSVFVTSRLTSEKRTKMIEDLRQRKIKAMIATSLADEGLDIPVLDAALIAGGGKSSTRLHQRIGRTLRKDKNGIKDKSIVIVYDHNAKHLNKHVKIVKRHLKKETEFVLKDSLGPNFICEEIDDVLGIKGDRSGLFNS